MSNPPAAPPNADVPQPRSFGDRILDLIEWAGNKLPDPAVLFVIALLATWAVSALLAPIEFTEIDPRTQGIDAATGKERTPQPIRVKNQLEGQALAEFLTRMVKTFTDFHPLGVVLVALLGVGVAEHTGYINAALKWLLSFTPVKLLSPMLILVAIMSHTAGDTGYVLVIPLGGVIYYAAGRHPLAGIAAAFAGVSGGFSANFIPSGLDPLLQGITQQSGQLFEPALKVNPLCNWFFMSSSCVLIVGIGWFVTDRIIEPRLRRTTPLDGDPNDMPKMEPMKPEERRGFYAGSLALALGLGLLALVCAPSDSPMRNKDGVLTGSGAPLMDAIVPLIFLLSLLPGIVHGIVAGTVKSSKDVVKGMSKSMGTMGYYLVMAFFAAQFIYAFGKSNLGALIAIKGASLLQEMQVPDVVTILGVIAITTLVNLLIGSASAKWALLGPIFVPMLMALGLSPELTQAAYRVGDSSTNIVTPLMPYFPLVVVYCQKYVKNTGIGTMISLMFPYSILFLLLWTTWLIIYWQLGFPLGLEARYGYP